VPARVKLSAILDALEMQGDETHAFLDRQSGDVVVLTDEELGAAEEEDADLSDYPDWQREAIEQAKAVQADEGGRFVALPDRFEIDEWEMMRDFALSVEDEAISAALLDAIHGRGAFRYFKDQVRERGLAESWHEFRAGRYRQIASDWCEAHGLELDAGA
jgi:hypothetical protein